MTEQLKTLWHLAFGDGEEAIDAFFRTAYAPERCRYLTENGRVTAALYWLDCAYRGQKQAYIYAVATHPDHRGRGLCRRLLADTHALLKEQGYAAALLVPAEEGLRAMYEKMGYRTCTHVKKFRCEAGPSPVSLRAVGPEEFARLRRRFLPASGVLQEEENIPFLARQMQFFAGDDFLLTAYLEEDSLTAAELLGNKDAAPGILSALGAKKGSFRCPGNETPFAMWYPLQVDTAAPGYFGFAFD